MSRPIQPRLIVLRRREELSEHLKRLDTLWREHGVYLDREETNADGTPRKPIPES